MSSTPTDPRRSTTPSRPETASWRCGSQGMGGCRRQLSTRAVASRTVESLSPSKDATMRRLLLCGMAGAAALLAGCRAEDIQGPSFAAREAQLDDAAAQSAPTYSYERIAYPNATATTAWGINASGDVVGDYVDAAGGRHGFLLHSGAFTRIDIAGALTSARGISPGGDIVGVYRGASEPVVNAHGFLLSRPGDTTFIDFPGHTNTIPQRILPDGTLLGCRHDNDTMGSMRGVVFDRGGSSEITEFASMNNGATPDRRLIVGLWTNGARGEGFTIADGVFATFVVPGSVFTAGWDVNFAGEDAGVAHNGHGFMGFVQTVDGEYVSIDFPGATATRVFGINARGDVVGAYVLGGQTNGFLARRGR